ncbi:hypothetical protein DBR32_14845 [Taibaiella sp. KBW10]|uniref:GNAT family N-acetyltransferase n=1 Tax=Taibaiella sp. KBW10 TaxID=2153357 RepID=UPI000F5AE435|nr:GNAT family N-acetyltransferase [Taibaiella sp. KBW10]RQO29856.1 hypothetical protein DBR32_14845 [Taibaiella sp. KBW10]
MALLITETLRLRSLEEADAPALWTCITRNKAYLQTWIPWVRDWNTADQVLEYIQDALHQIDAQEALSLGLFSEEQLIGIVSLQEWDHALGIAELGFWIDEAFQHKGIMRQAIRRMMQFGFTEMKLNKVEVTFVRNNKRVQQLMERLGFRIEGIIRNKLLHQGLPADRVVAGLLKQEFI